jgi:Outer membrane protein beta-barrel domain
VFPVVSPFRLRVSQHLTMPRFQLSVKALSRLATTRFTIGKCVPSQTCHSAPFGCGDCCRRPLAMWGLRPALMTATSLTSERSGQISASLRPSDALRGLLRSGPTGEEVAPRQCCHGLRRGTSHPACSTAEVTVCQRLRAHPAPARSVTLSDPSRPAHTRLTSTRVFTPARVALFVRLCQPAPLPSVNRSTTVSPFGWTAGGGVEFAISPNWSVKAEYLYVDLQNDTIGRGTFRLIENVVRGA